MAPRTQKSNGTTPHVDVAPPAVQNGVETFPLDKGDLDHLAVLKARFDSEVMPVLELVGPVVSQAVDSRIERVLMRLDNAQRAGFVRTELEAERALWDTVYSSTLNTLIALTTGAPNKDDIIKALNEAGMGAQDFAEKAVQRRRDSIARNYAKAAQQTPAKT
jgi:hypothetical protein